MHVSIISILPMPKKSIKDNQYIWVSSLPDMDHGSSGIILMMPEEHHTLFAKSKTIPQLLETCCWEEAGLVKNLSQTGVF